MISSSTVGRLGRKLLRGAGIQSGCVSSRRSWLLSRQIACSPRLYQADNSLRSTQSQSPALQFRLEQAAEVEELDELFDKVYPMVREYWLQNSDPSNPVVEYVPPKELSQILGQLPDSGQGVDKVVEGIQKALKYSVRTAHPRYFDKLCAGSDATGQVAEFVTSVLNTNVHTYAVAPVFAMMEVACIKEMARIIGWDPEKSDGIMMPGGTFANIHAFYVARHEMFPHVRKEGWRPEDNPVCFTSAQCHYSIQRAAMMAGMGFDGCVAVAADRRGCMIPEALDDALSKAKEEGKTPFFVNVTTGTTVMGGYDPVDKLHEVIEKHNPDIWMHADGCWGGSVVTSDTHRHLVNGIEYADSMSWSPQKALGVGIYSAALIMNDHYGALARANRSGLDGKADYLFHQHEASEYDLADKSLQCGRRPDSLKLWLSFQRHGRTGMGQRIDTAFENARYLAERIKERKDNGFHLVEEPMGQNVCWWYVPENLRGHNDIESIYPHLDKVTPRVYDIMQREGSMLINFNPLADHGLPRFFRITLNQPRVTKEDMDFVLDEMDRLGRDVRIAI